MTDSATEPKTRGGTWRHRVRLGLAAAAILLVAGAPWWGPFIMRRMSFFRVRKVEIVGARYVSVADILDRLRVDTTASVWDAPGPLARRVGTHPQVRSVAIRRRLPGTLIVEVEENLPVALIPSADGFRVLDARGVALPIDLAKMPVDAPVISERDLGVLRLLSALRTRSPALYARVSEVRLSGPDEFLLVLRDVPVRAMRGVTPERLADIEPVEEDLGRRRLRAAEIDLRYRDQVIARLP